MSDEGRAPAVGATPVNPTNKIPTSPALHTGWPVGGLLAPRGRGAEAATFSGVITENDGQGQLLVRERDGETAAIALDHATSIIGLDGYPMSLTEVRIGDIVEILWEKCGSGLVTTEIYLVRPT